jgi:pyruvate/2-oxoglutarate dehydrogenase complex dihydrolipoamide acyltransferase (E2) component
MSANNDSPSRTSRSSSVQKPSGEKATSEQQYTGQGAQEAPDVAGGVGNPDIDFSASVKARELRFEEEPQTKVRFWGHPERNSVSVNERKNLPEEVRQGVTYQNISVRSRIASELIAPEEEPYATNAAMQKAERLGVELHEVRGSGVDGLITLKDVSRAVQG